MKTSRAVLMAGALALAPLQRAHAQIHLEWAAPIQSGPSTGDSITRALESTGEKMVQLKAQGPRTAHFDLVFSTTLDEYRAMAANGVLLISAVAKDPKEFPLKRVYIRSGDKEISLVRISSRLSEVPKSSALVNTIGSNREDEFYLLPGYLAGQKAQLMIDFAANRAEFSLGQLTLTLPGPVQSAAETLPGQPSTAALKGLLAREYPDLVKP